MYQNSQQSTAYEPYYPAPIPTFNKIKTEHNGLDLIQSKSVDLIASLVDKIISGIVKALPGNIEKIFGDGFHELLNFNDQPEYGSYNQGVYGSQTVDMKKIFKNMGLFGYIPMVILKIIDGITTFMNILKKNAFFKNFLFPALILLVIGGSVLLLIWWLHPDSNSSHGNSNYQISYSNAPEYSFPPNTNDYYDTPYNTNMLYKKYGNQPNVNQNTYHHRSYSRSYYDF